MDKYLNYKEYLDFKRDVLDPLESFINDINEKLKRSKDVISELKLNLEIPSYEEDIENDLPDNEEYEIFCEKIILEFDFEIRECELNRFRTEETKIPFWDFKNLFYDK